MFGGHATIGRLSKNVSSTFQAIKHFLKQSLNGHAKVVGGHATVGRLSNNVFGRFKQFGKILKKVAERSRDSGRRSRYHRPTIKQRVLGRFKQFGKILKKVAERSRESGRRSRYHRPTVNVFSTFQAIWENFEKKR